MKLYYSFTDSGVHPILWDGRTPFALNATESLLSETEYDAWKLSKPAPIHDPRTEKIRPKKDASGWLKIPLDSAELKEIEKADAYVTARLILADLNAGTAKNSDIQKALAYVLSRHLP